MNSTINLLELLRPMLKEIGDLKNIEPYDYGKVTGPHVEFKTEKGDKVEVSIKQIQINNNNTNKRSYKVQTDIPNTIINKNKEQVFYNLGFSVNDSDTQARISDIKYLLKIIKTVIDILSEMIIETEKRNWDPDTIQYIYTVIPVNKAGSFKTDKQKEAFYYILLSKHMLPGYRLVRNVKMTVEGSQMNVIMITKK